MCNVRPQATDYDKVSSAYASALVELAQDKNALDTVHADVDSLQVCLGPCEREGLPTLHVRLRCACRGNMWSTQKAAS